MSIPVPNLDDRKFQDIVDEAKRLIPRYCPEWTDHNVSDPGVTLIEAFAAMADQARHRAQTAAQQVEEGRALHRLQHRHPIVLRPHAEVVAAEARLGLSVQQRRAVIAWVRARYMDTPFLQAAFQIVAGGVLVFLPQILLLFFFLGLLEDLGYLDPLVKTFTYDGKLYSAPFGSSMRTRAVRVSARTCGSIYATVPRAIGAVPSAPEIETRSVSRVSSGGDPRRMGGPQYPVPRDT